MNFTGFLACAIVAVWCGEMATGNEPQTLFAHDAIWVWWIIAICWAINALGFVVRFFVEE